MKKSIIFAFALLLSFYSYSQPMTMVPIQGGWFNPDGEEFEKKIYVSSFEMSAYETTIGQFQEFVREEYNSLDDLDRELLDDRGYADPLGCIYEYFSAEKQFPVFKVRYYSALKFCNWLSKKEGLEPVYTRIMEDRDVVWNKTANGYRLPTKAEWMYAAGCANQDKRMYDNSIENLKEIANIQVKLDTIVEVVGQKLPNKWGLYDMIGNVCEWCWDYAGTDNCTINPTGPLHGRKTNDYIDDGQRYDGTRDRVNLGFDCQTNVKYIDITKPRETPASVRVNYGLIGFRVVRNLPAKQAYINDDRVRCREMPGLNGKILGMFNKGDELEVVDEIRFNKTDKYNWCYVRVKSDFYNFCGWVYGEYVSER